MMNYKQMLIFVKTNVNDMLEFVKNIAVDEEQTTVEVKNIIKKGLGKYTENEALRIILGCIDLTTLEGADTKAKVDALCEKGMNFKNKGNDIPNVAAICIYPPFARQVSEKLKDSGLKTACVAGAFPSGQSPLFVKLAEVEYAVKEGADEIDMVISRGTLLEGNFQCVYDEILAIKKSCGKAHLKVILETGELQSLSNVRIASDIAIAAGGDFIKTSTGKINPAATEEAFYVMLQAIKDYYEKTGKMIGIKPAGGISEPEQALHYFILVNHVLGEKWLNNIYFRVGASRLADKILERLM
ncbi:MAG: deoxyribose-phosphate aldolase [Bacteroidetes bacterium]|nr:deoxyribose-phosphate aldolase [Bacteroidota bacterium]